MNTQTKRSAQSITAQAHRELIQKLPVGTVSDSMHRKGKCHGEPLILLMESLHTYAVAHEQRFESKLADDYVLGPDWLSAIKGVRGLLNGEGQFDAGTLEGLFWSALGYAGYTEADL